MVESETRVRTPDGEMTAFVARPDAEVAIADDHAGGGERVCVGYCMGAARAAHGARGADGMTGACGRPGFTIVNLLDVDDSAGDRFPGIEARFARKHLDSEHLGVTYLRYAPDMRASSAHSHREQEEAYVVVRGSGRVLLDGEETALRQWDVVRCSPQTVRAFAAGPDGLDLIAIGSDRPEGGDGIQAEAVWSE